ncbi:MAG TPA: hypothetical protein VHD62_02315 [Opitutaceae bacterium]|nr:hypothetical protein [Opitutaceae bacterium]
MSAKKNRNSVPAASAPQAAATARPAPVAAAAEPVAPAPVAWIDSPDPRKRQFAKIFQVALWIYIAALFLLAFDQWFNWGIFGPKVPPVP